MLNSDKSLIEMCSNERAWSRSRAWIWRGLVGGGTEPKFKEKEASLGRLGREDFWTGLVSMAMTLNCLRKYRQWLPEYLKQKKPKKQQDQSLSWICLLCHWEPGAAEQRTDWKLPTKHHVLVNRSERHLGRENFNWEETFILLVCWQACGHFLG